MDERELIRGMYRQYWRYMIEKNADGLRGMMTQDYCLFHMTGARQSADEFLKGLLDGTFRYSSAEHDSIDVQIRGDRACMTGCSRILASVYGGNTRIWRLRGDFTLRKDRGEWKLSSSRASAY